MEIEITDEKPMAEAKIDMVGFKRMYKQDLDLRKAITQNFIAVNKDKMSPDTMLQYAIYAVDWGLVLDRLNEIDKDEMVLKYVGIRFTDKTEYKPDIVKPTEGKIIIEPEIKDGEDIIIVNSYIGCFEFDIKQYLNWTTFNFGRKNWNTEVVM